MQILLWIWCWGAVALLLGHVLGNAATEGARKPVLRSVLQAVFWPLAVLWLAVAACRDRWAPSPPSERSNVGRKAR